MCKLLCNTIWSKLTKYEYKYQHTGKILQVDGTRLLVSDWKYQVVSRNWYIWYIISSPWIPGGEGPRTTVPSEPFWHLCISPGIAPDTLKGTPRASPLAHDVTASPLDNFGFIIAKWPQIYFKIFKYYISKLAVCGEDKRWFADKQGKICSCNIWTFVNK